MGWFSAARANTFAMQIKQRFPHISQLEVAEGIDHEELDDFIEQQRQSGHDRFKQINDLYGHRTGDQVLQVVAERIRQFLRREDLAVRLGGDEFLVIFSGIASADKIRGVVDKLRRKIEAPIQIEKLTLFVGVSIGTALYPDEVKNPIDLIDLADQAMYKNKAERQLQKVHPINNTYS